MEIKVFGQRVWAVYLFQMTLLTLFVVLGLEGVERYILVERKVPLLYSIPLFHYVFAWLYITVFCILRSRMPSKITPFYLVAKVVKMMMAFGCVMLYRLLGFEERVIYGVLFLVCYMIYLIFDSCFFVLHETRKKKE